MGYFMTTRTWRAVAIMCLMALLLSAAACSGGGDGDETPTVPTIDAAFEQTQAAVNTEEARAIATSTRAPGAAEQPTAATGVVRVATTNELVDTGLLDVLTPLFEAETGYQLDVLRISGSAALTDAAANADALLVHWTDEEEAIITNGDLIEPSDVFRGDFVIVGADTDPASVRNQERADDALRSIFNTEATFITTIDGTAAREHELRVWTGLQLLPQGAWYESSDQTVPATLALASERGGYAISDRFSYLAAGNEIQLEILLAGDPAQVDAYRIMIVNPDVQPNVNAEGARAFAAFLVRPDVQQIISEFGVAEFGEAIFVPTAGG